MATGIRTEGLRKLYSSPPPLASGGGFSVPMTRPGKKLPAEVVALDGLSLEVAPGEMRRTAWRPGAPVPPFIPPCGRHRARGVRPRVALVRLAPV